MNFEICEAGRVKMSGSSVDMYYDAAQPLIDEGITGAAAAHSNFITLRDNPPAALRSAYFPSTGHGLAKRVRGPGLYRYLRTDQGPGGNFTGFCYNPAQGGQSAISLGQESPHAILEQSVSEQIDPNSALGMLAANVTAAYASSDLGGTFSHLKAFEEETARQGVELPTGKVGGRSGFFYIHPVESQNAILGVDIKPQVEVALERARELASSTLHFMHIGHRYRESMALASQPENRALTYYDDDAFSMLYFQPDCFVDMNGAVVVEKINFPDVGFFLRELDGDNNAPLQQVQNIIEGLSRRLGQAVESNLPGDIVTIVAKDEAIHACEDTLEVLEIKALTKLLGEIGYTAEVIGVSELNKLRPHVPALLLNPAVDSHAFERFTEHVVKHDVVVYPHPLLKTYESEATTIRTVDVRGEMLGIFLALIKPKRIEHPGPLHEQLFRILNAAKIEEDIIYFDIPGMKTHIPTFRYSLHSFAQVYNAVEKARKAGHEVNEIKARLQPFSRKNAVFGDASGKRLAVFRAMGMVSVT